MTAETRPSYRQLAAQDPDGPHHTTIRARMLRDGDVAAHLPAKARGDRGVWPGSLRPEVIAARDARIVELRAGGSRICDITRAVGCCRQTVRKVLRRAEAGQIR